MTEYNPILQDKRSYKVTNTLLIVGILFKSTNNYDQGEKFNFYRSIPGFVEYILVNQYQCFVNQFAKS